MGTVASTVVHTGLLNIIALHVPSHFAALKISRQNSIKICCGHFVLPPTQNLHRRIHGLPCQPPPPPLLHHQREKWGPRKTGLGDTGCGGIQRGGQGVEGGSDFDMTGMGRVNCGQKGVHG